MPTRLSVVLLLIAPLWGQSTLSLKDAVALALQKNPSVEAGKAGEQAAALRIKQAQSGYLPKLNYQESYARSDNPVFVFSSLLTQHQFTENNFRIDTLNRPDSLNNFQSQLSVDQVIYDGGQTRLQVRSAELGHGIAGEQDRGTRMNVIAGAVRAYYDALLSAENLKVAREAMRSAEADLKRAEAVRSAGMSTDADVLSIRVHLASVNEQQIQRKAALEAALAALNQALGVPLDTQYDLTASFAAAPVPELTRADYEKKAVELRPEARQSGLATRLADTQSAAAHSALLPQVVLHGAFEADRERFINRGGANWLASVSLRWNVFNGFGDKARIDVAAQELRRARAQQQSVDSAIRLQVTRAYLDLQSAEARIEVAKAAVAMAEESLRITKNRYENGLTTVTDLLRNETAVLEARLRHVATIHDQRLAAMQLELAAGTLNPDSEVLN
jgi:outer membrane protein